MSANKFIDSPPAIIVWNPLDDAPPSAFVALGDVPAAIYNAVREGGSAALLKDYYGPSYKEKLLQVNLATLLPKYVGGDDTVDVGTVNIGTVNVGTVNVGTVSTNPASMVSPPVHGGDADLDEIEALLSESVNTTHVRASAVKAQGAINVQLTPGVTYVRDVAIYPEDRYDELKNKIYLITGIPPYRQHIFYLDNGRPQTIYKLYTDGIATTDIRSLAFGTTKIHGIPIDKSIYDQRDVAKVEAMDIFQTLETTLHDNRIFVVDLGAITNIRRTQLLELLKDTYQFELLYYGFILKYWPQLTLDCFRDYISDEPDLQHRYPDLAPSLATLRTVYKHERAIIDNCYHNMPKLMAIAESNSFGLAITQMTAQVAGAGVMLNIRNVFEHFHTSKMIPEIHAWIENDNKRYLLVKKHVQAEDIAFPSGNTMRVGITFAISLRTSDFEGNEHTQSGDAPEGTSEQSRYLFLNIWPSGRYHMKSVWNEEDEFGFDETTAVMKKYVDPVIKEINSLGYYAFVSMGKLVPVGKAVLTYQSLTVCLFWKRVMTESTYKIVRGLWEPYFRAQIVGARNVQQFDKYEFALLKGIYQFDNTAIERIISASNNITVNNYYAHLSNQQIGQKWKQNYNGRVVKMSHRTTDIRFEISDIREHEFRTAQVYILGFIHSAATSSEVRAAAIARRDYTEVKKLRKLREQDPELYNLKKYGSKKVYSIVCQNQRQPIIYTDDELHAMSAKDKAALTEYWNFTLNRPAWYGCPSRAYPHLSFMVGVHPKHYCLPCCNKKMREDDESRKARVNVGCLKNHEWKIVDTSISRHIMNYGKDIEVGRLSRLPQTSLKNLLHDTIVRTDADIADTTSRDPLGYYLYGVPQHFPGAGNLGIVYAVAAALSLDVSEYISGIIKHISQIAIDTLLRGVLTEYFRDARELSAVMRDIFIEGSVLASVRIPYWPELFIELTQNVYNISVVTFIDSSGNGIGINLHVVESAKNAIISGDSSCICLIKRENNYYPMFVIYPEVYFRRAEIRQRVYPSTSPLTKLIRSMLPVVRGSGQLNLQVMKEFCLRAGRKITRKFINQHNLCYGIEIAGTDAMNTDRVYCPVDYSTNLPDMIPVSNIPDATTEYRLENTVSLYSELSKYLAKLEIKPIAVTALIYHNNVLIGARTRVGTVYITSAESSSIPIESCDYDFRDVNAVITRREPPTPDGRSQVSKALYHNYRYQLFIIEFVNYLDKERNAELREKIYTLISETNFKRDLAKFRAELKSLINPQDYATLQNQISEFYYRGMSKPALLAAITGRTYEFDRITLTHLQSIGIERAESELLKIASTFAVEGDPNSVGDFPNIYLPCEESHAGYCSGKKLVLRDMKQFVSVLAQDIFDELRVAYLLNNVWMDAVVDVFKFTKSSTELISIYRLTD